MTLLSNVMVLISTHEDSHRITFLSKSTADLRFCIIYQHFLSHRLFSLSRLFRALYPE